MKILLIGKDGQIGKSLFNALKGSHEIFPLGRKECDLQNKNEIISVFNNTKVDIVINAAAYTDVDKAESDPKKVFLINSDAIETISLLTKNNGIPLIHYSTDYVFDGKKNKKYLEDDEENPINIYGESKLFGEKYTKFNDKHIIIRTSRVFSASGNNFISKIINLAETKDKLDIVSDQIATPTSSEFISKITSNLISYMGEHPNINIFGTYHLVADGSCSWYDYAKVIVEEALKLDYPLKVDVDSIYAVLSNDFKSNAKRPKNSVLCTSKIKSLLSFEMPWWEDDVRRATRDIIKNKIKQIS